MKPRQAVSGHSNIAVPLVFELDPREQGKEPLERSTPPLGMNELTWAAKRAHAPEDQPTLLIKAEGAEDHLGIPNALSLGQDRPPQMVAERLGREIEVGQKHKLGADLRPDVDRVGVRGNDHPLRPYGSAAGAHQPRAVLLLGVDHRV